MVHYIQSMRIDVHLFVLIALTDDSAIALGHIRRTPAYIQMMHRYEQRLDVGPCSHFGSAAQQHTHLSAAYLGEKFCFLVLRICVVDELDLLFGHTGVEQLGANIIINDISIYGQDSNPTTWKLAQMNLAIRGIEPDLGKYAADTFLDDQHPTMRADYIMANPPFNLSMQGSAVR